MFNFNKTVVKTVFMFNIQRTVARKTAQCRRRKQGVRVSSMLNADRPCSLSPAWKKARAGKLELRQRINTHGCFLGSGISHLTLVVSSPPYRLCVYMIFLV